MAYEGPPPKKLELEIKTVQQAGCSPGDIITSPDGKKYKIDAIDNEGAFLMEMDTDGKWMAALNDEPQNLDVLFESGWIKKPSEPSATTTAPTAPEAKATETEAVIEQVTEEINQEADELHEMQNRLADLQTQMQRLRSQTGLRRFFSKITAAETRLETEINELAEQIKNFRTISQPQTTEGFTAQEEAFFAKGEAQEAEAEQLVQQIEEMSPVVPEVPQERKVWMQNLQRTGKFVFVAGCLISVFVTGREMYRGFMDLPAANAELASGWNLSSIDKDDVAQNN
jgi:hypothetical protein